MAPGAGVDPAAAGFKAPPVRRHSRNGSGPECRSLPERAQNAPCPAGAIRYLWCQQDGIEPPYPTYKVGALPLDDAGKSGVTNEDRTRTCAFTVRRADHYTTATIGEAWWNRTT